MPNKTANAPIHALMAERWSPRSFSDRAVTEDQVLALLQAARWSPSCFNDQPWRFIVGLRGRADGRYAQVLECLNGGNRVWADRAPLLLIACASHRFRHNDQPNRWAAYDTGAAMMSVTLQAQALGLHVHQMGGFNADTVRSTFELRDDIQPMAVAAIGYRSNDISHLPEWASEREGAPRERLVLDNLLL